MIPSCLSTSVLVTNESVSKKKGKKFANDSFSNREKKKPSRLFFKKKIISVLMINLNNNKNNKIERNLTKFFKNG